MPFVKVTAEDDQMQNFVAVVTFAVFLIIVVVLAFVRNIFAILLVF